MIHNISKFIAALTVRRATTLTVTRAAVMLLVMMLTATTATAAVINVASTADLGTKTPGSDETYSDYYLLADGNTYRLTADVNLDGYLRMENATVTIDLNGHKLNRGLTESTKTYNGCVIMARTSTLTICDSGSGGTITGGYSKDGAGGLYVNMNSTVTMTSGTISGNYADKTAGGVYIHYTSTFNMTGGTVTNNTSGSNGKCGGVYIHYSSKQNKYGTFNVSGSARITANKLGSTTSNVYLPSGGTFNVTGALTGYASVGVTMEDGTGTFAQGGGSPAYSITESDLTHFKSDISSHYVWYQPDSDGKAYLTDDDPTLYYKLTWNATGGYFEIRDEQDLIDLGDFTASNAANTCEGLTFKLTADLDFTNMPTRKKVNGNNGNFHPIGLVEDASFDGIFSGHFDGQNHTIKGLRYTNKIKLDSNYNDITGLFKTVDGSSAVVERVILIDPQISGTDNGCGGIAGLIRNGATIRNCTVLGGTITRTGNGMSGGIVGSNSSKAATIEGCTVIGTSVQDGMIIGYGNSQQTIKDCIYYTTSSIGIADNTYTDGGGNQRVYQLTLGDDVTTSTAATYSSALLPGKAYYTSGATVTLSNSATGAPQGYQYTYTASAGTLSGTTLTMPDQDVTISAALAPIDWATVNKGDSADPYMIYNKDQLLLLAHRVNGTNGETANDYYGMYFKLGADITFTHDENEGDDYDENYEAIGGVFDGYSYYFKGDFDGDGHTVSGIRIRKDGTGINYGNVGLFGYLDEGSNVHDVHLTDARITGYEDVGGIAGYTYGTVSGCTVTDSYITATGNWICGTICGENDGTLRNNYYHGCTVNGTAVTSGEGCLGADITANNGALPAYRLDLGANITTPPGTFADQTVWLDTPPVSPRLAPENGFTLAGNHYFASGYVFTPGSTLASGAAQGYTPRATLGDQLLDLYTPTGDADLLAGKAIARLTITADCDGKTLASTQAIYSTRQPVTVAYIKADDTPGEASAIALDGTETSLGAGTYFAGLENVNFDHTVNLTGDVTLILADGCTMNVGTSGSRIDGKGFGNPNYNIDIYAQSLGTGALTIYNSSTYSGRAPIAASALTINGGIITADASGTNAIYANKDVTINRGTVTANGHDYGIYISSGDIIISGGTVNATAGTSYSGINARAGNVAINGGNVTATGGTYGIRAGDNITLGWTRPADRITASSISTGGGTVAVADGQALTDGSGHIYTGTLTASELSGFAAETTLQPCLALADAADNTAAITDHAGQTLAVALSGRTLYKDGSWNTLCLPFAVDLTASGPLSGDNVQAMTLNTSSSNLADGTLTLNFDAAETIPAGTPFIIKWDNTGVNITNPVFMGVTVSNATNDAIVEGVLTFTGTYAPVRIGSDGDNTKLYLGAANKLYYPTKSMTIGTHRAYFQLADGITAGEPASLVRAFNLNFGDDEATGIISVHDSGFTVNGSAAWYTLDGRRLDGQPTAKGLYIHGGKKVAIK